MSNVEEVKNKVEDKKDVVENGVKDNVSHFFRSKSLLLINYYYRKIKPATLLRTLKRKVKI